MILKFILMPPKLGIVFRCLFKFSSKSLFIQLLLSFLLVYLPVSICHTACYDPHRNREKSPQKRTLKMMQNKNFHFLSQRILALITVIAGPTP